MHGQSRLTWSLRSIAGADNKLTMLYTVSLLPCQAPLNFDGALVVSFSQSNACLEEK